MEFKIVGSITKDNVEDIKYIVEVLTLNNRLYDIVAYNKIGELLKNE